MTSRIIRTQSHTPIVNNKSKEKPTVSRPSRSNIGTIEEEPGQSTPPKNTIQSKQPILGDISNYLNNTSTMTTHNFSNVKRYPTVIEEVFVLRDENEELRKRIIKLEADLAEEKEFTQKAAAYIGKIRDDKDGNNDLGDPFKQTESAEPPQESIAGEELEDLIDNVRETLRSAAEAEAKRKEEEQRESEAELVSEVSAHVDDKRFGSKTSKPFMRKPKEKADRPISQSAPATPVVVAGDVKRSVTPVSAATKVVHDIRNQIKKSKQLRNDEILGDSSRRLDVNNEFDILAWQRQRQEYVSEIASLSNKLADWQGNLSVLSSNYRSLTAKITQLAYSAEKVSFLTEDLNQLRREHGLLRDQMRESEAKYVKSTNHVRIVLQALIESQSEIDNLKDKIVQAEKEKAVLLEESKSISINYSIQISDLQDSHRKALAAAEKQIAKLRDQVTVLEQEKVRLVERLSSSVSEMSVNQNVALAETARELDNLKQQVKLLEEEKDNLKLNEEASQSTIQSLNATIKQLQSQQSDISSESKLLMESLSIQLKSLQQEKLKLNDRIKSLVAGKTDSVNIALAKAEEELIKLSQIQTDSQLKILQLTTQISQLEEKNRIKVNDLTMELESTKKKFKDLINEKTSIEKEYHSRFLIISSQVSEIEKIQAIDRELNSIVTEQQSVIAQSKVDLDKLQRKIIDIENDKNEMLQESYRNIEDLNHKILLLQEKLKQSESDASLKSETLNQQMKLLEISKAASEEKALKLSQQIFSLETEILTLKQSSAVSPQTGKAPTPPSGSAVTRGSSRITHSPRPNGNSLIVDELQTQLKNLTKEKYEKDKETEEKIKQLNTQITDLNDNRRKESRATELKIQSLNQRLELLTKEKNTLQTRIDQYQIEIKTLKEKELKLNESNTIEVSKLQAQLDSLTKQKLTIEEQSKSKINELNQMLSQTDELYRNKVTSSNQEISSLKDQINKLYDEKNQIYDDSRNRLNELTQQLNILATALEKQQKSIITLSSDKTVPISNSNSIITENQSSKTNLTTSHESLSNNMIASFETQQIQLLTLEKKTLEDKYFIALNEIENQKLSIEKLMSHDKETITELENTIQSLNDQLTNIQREKNLIHEESILKINSLAKQITTLEQQVIALQQDKLTNITSVRNSTDMDSSSISSSIDTSLSVLPDVILIPLKERIATLEDEKNKIEQSSKSKLIQLNRTIYTLTNEINHRKESENKILNELDLLREKFSLLEEEKLAIEKEYLVMAAKMVKRSQDTVVIVNNNAVINSQTSAIPINGDISTLSSISQDYNTIQEEYNKDSSNNDKDNKKDFNEQDSFILETERTSILLDDNSSIHQLTLPIVSGDNKELLELKAKIEMLQKQKSSLEKDYRLKINQNQFYNDMQSNSTKLSDTNSNPNTPLAQSIALLEGKGSELDDLQSDIQMNSNKQLELLHQEILLLQQENSSLKVQSLINLNNLEEKYLNILKENELEIQAIKDQNKNLYDDKMRMETEFMNAMKVLETINQSTNESNSRDNSLSPSQETKKTVLNKSPSYGMLHEHSIKSSLIHSTSSNPSDSKPLIPMTLTHLVPQSSIKTIDTTEQITQSPQSILSNELTNLQMKISNLTDENHNLSFDIEKLNQQIKIMEDEKQKLDQDYMEHVSKLVRQIYVDSQYRTVTEPELESLKSHNQSLLNQIKLVEESKMNEINHLMNEMNELNNKIQTLQNEKSKILEQSAIDSSTLLLRYDQLKVTSEQLLQQKNEELKSYELKLNDLTNEYTKADESKRTIENQLLIIQNQLNIKQEQLTKYESLMQSKEQEIHQLQITNTNLMKNLDESESKNTTKQKKINLLNDELATIESIRNTLNQSIEKLNNDIKDLTIKYNETTNELKQIQEEKKNLIIKYQENEKSLHEQIIYNQNQLNNLREKEQKQQQQYENHVDKLSNDIVTYQKQLQQLTERNDKLLIDFDTLQNNNNTTINQLNNVANDYKELQSKYQTENIQNNSIINDLKQQLSEKITQLNENRLQLQQFDISKQELIQSYENKINKYRQSITVLNNQYEQTILTNSNKYLDLEKSYQSEIETLKTTHATEIDSLTNKYQNQISNYETNNQELMNKNKLLLKEKESYIENKKQYQQAMGQLNSMKEAQGRLLRDVETYKRHITTLQQEKLQLEKESSLKYSLLQKVNENQSSKINSQHKKLVSLKKQLIKSQQGKSVSSLMKQKKSLTACLKLLDIIQTDRKNYSDSLMDLQEYHDIIDLLYDRSSKIEDVIASLREEISQGEYYVIRTRQSSKSIENFEAALTKRREAGTMKWSGTNNSPSGRNIDINQVNQQYNSIMATETPTKEKVVPLSDTPKEQDKTIINERTNSSSTPTTSPRSTTATNPLPLPSQRSDTPKSPLARKDMLNSGKDNRNRENGFTFQTIGSFLGADGGNNALVPVSPPKKIEEPPKVDESQNSVWGNADALNIQSWFANPLLFGQNESAATSSANPLAVNPLAKRKDEERKRDNESSYTYSYDSFDLEAQDNVKSISNRSSRSTTPLRSNANILAANANIAKRDSPNTIGMVTTQPAVTAQATTSSFLPTFLSESSTSKPSLSNDPMDSGYNSDDKDEIATVDDTATSVGDEFEAQDEVQKSLNALLDELQSTKTEMTILQSKIESKRLSIVEMNGTNDDSSSSAVIAIEADDIDENYNSSEGQLIPSHLRQSQDAYDEGKNEIYPITRMSSSDENDSQVNTNDEDIPLHLLTTPSTVDDMSVLDSTSAIVEAETATVKDVINAVTTSAITSNYIKNENISKFRSRIEKMLQLTDYYLLQNDNEDDINLDDDENELSDMLNENVDHERQSNQML